MHFVNRLVHSVVLITTDISRYVRDECAGRAYPLCNSPPATRPDATYKDEQLPVDQAHIPRYPGFRYPADIVRLTFHIGGVPFVDNRITKDTFPQLKESLPFGQIPVLEIDGQVIMQSQAILRYTGRLAGLYPTNDPLAALKIEEVLHGMEEAQEAIWASFREPDPETKKEMRTELAESTLPRYLALLEARLVTFAKYATLQTKDVLLHDIAIYAFVKSLRVGIIDHILVTVADGYPLIEQSFQKVATHPKVQEWYVIQHNTPKVKLTYFPRPGRAEPIRLALFLGDIAFEDECITPEELALRKPSLPFNQLPVLQIDDDSDVIAQSLAILCYVGSLSGLYPTANPIEAFQIDELLCLIDELYNNIGSSSREDPEKQLELHKVLADETIPKFLGDLDKRTAQHASGPYAIGAKPSVADLAIIALLNDLQSGSIVGVPATIVDPFQNLLKIRERVQAHPKIVEWNKTHADQ